MERKLLRVGTVHLCGPVPGGRGYFDFAEHAEQKRRRKRCEPTCFFCERARHPERYVYVHGVWIDTLTAEGA